MTQTILILALSLWTSILIVELIRGVRRRVSNVNFHDIVKRENLLDIVRPNQDQLATLYPKANKKTSLEDYPTPYIKPKGWA